MGSNVSLLSGVVVDTALEPISVYGNGATDAEPGISEFELNVCKIESQIFQLSQTS